MTTSSTPPALPVVLTAAGRHRGVGGGFRYRHGWIPLDGSKNVKEAGDEIANDRPSMGRGSEAVRAARSEARQRLDAALSRLDKAQPEVARRQRAALNELRTAGKLTPDRIRIATDAANRAALPSGHGRATAPGEGLGADKFGGGNRDAGNGGHGGTGADVKPKAAAKSSSGGDSSVRGDSQAAKNARRAVFDLSGAGPEDRQAQLRKMSDVELRNAHEAVRAQHKDAQGSHDKAGLKALSDDIRAEHTRRKQAKKSVTASAGLVVVASGPRSLTAATAEDGSKVPDDYYSKKSGSSKSSSSKSGGKSGGGKGGFSEDKHPRQPKGADNGGEFAPAGGAGKDDAGKKAQANKSAQANFLKLASMNPADSKKFLAGLSEKDLTELTEIAYSAKTSDKKVVTQRMQIASEMGRRGLDVKKHGARGGGITEKAKPAAKKTPAKKAVKASAGPVVHLGGDTAPVTAAAACEPPRVLVTIGGGDA